MYMKEQSEIAVFAGGCFWCTEAIFKMLRGVISVESGYTGGTIENPTYEQVSMGNTGHAEAIKIQFDPQIISYEKLVDIFLNTHNPTTLNRQGADTGPQYRSAIFYTTQEQQKKALSKIEQFNKNNTYGKNAVTSIEEYKKFFKAEDYHQDYYQKNKNYPYCTIVIDPKIKKLIKEYREEIKQS